MTMKTTLLIGALVAGSAVASSASAQNASPLKLTQTLDIVRTTTVDGKSVEKLVDATKVGPFPGEVLQNGFRAEVVGKTKLTNIRLPVKVPANTSYLSQQCSSPEVKATYSIDGGKTFAAAPLKKTVTVTENGKSVTKTVTVDPSEYQAIKWDYPAMNPSSVISCSMRLKVK